MIRATMTIIWLILLLLSILFVSINSQFVVIHYYFGQWKLYLPLLILLGLLLGLVLSFLICVPLWLRLMRKQRQLQVKVKALDQEIINLRHIPIKDID